MSLDMEGLVRKHSDREDETRITTACLLAAGIGSRLWPLTEAMPKCLTKIGGRPLLERLVNPVSFSR